MLKTIPPTTNCSCNYFKTKCAEIHYQSSEFSILCIFCGKAMKRYRDFINHFNNQHFEAFTNNLESTAESVITTMYESVLLPERIHHDPLAFKEMEMEMEISEHLEQKMPKTAVWEFAVTENGHPDNNSILVTTPNAFDSDDEYVVCKVKLERSDFKATKLTKRQRAKGNRVVNDSHKQIENAELQTKELMYTNQWEQKRSTQADAMVSSDVHLAATDDEENEALLVGVNWSEPYSRNNDKRPYKPRNKPNICTYCGRTFRRRHQLDTHLNIHTGLKPHQCEICGRQFRADSTLSRHMNTHERRETYGCKYCDKSFTHRAALVSHELRHTQKRRVPCDECDKYFYTANQMDTHKRKVHHKTDDKTLPFACKLCAKRYRSASMLSTHKFKKHYKTAQFCCQQCGKKFINEQLLEAHKFIHVDGLTTNANL